MTLQEFEMELKAIDPRLTVAVNQNRPQLANIKLNGMDICPIPSGEIREEPDPSYTLEMPNGWIVKHKSRQEALALVNNTLENIKTQEGYDRFFGQ